LSYADLAAAAHLSVVDYLGDVPWNDDEAAKDWYARVKSRPSFRPLLADRIVGTPASATYADLDF
jgi:glutathione S-transferase